MLIVITQDQSIINWCNSPSSQARNWGTLNFVNAGGAPGASVQLRKMLSQVSATENLCITGHGNDTEVGDADTHGAQSWSWSASDIADMLISNLPKDFSGNLLMEVCSDTMTSFAANLVQVLNAKKGLKNVWIYGYTKGVSVTHPFPAPGALAKNVELSSHKCG